MAHSLLYSSEKEKRLHQRSIERIVRETGLPKSDIIFVYEAILDDFKQRAKVSDFLPILVSKEVKHVLLESSNLRKENFR